MTYGPGSADPEVVTGGQVKLLMLTEPGVPPDRATHFRRSIAGAAAHVTTGVAVQPSTGPAGPPTPAVRGRPRAAQREGTDAVHR